MNIENKGKDPRRQMPYEQYLEIDLPHGPAVSLELWNRVQQTVKRASHNRTMDKATHRTYPLSLVLKSEDGTSFGGQGAWSASQQKHCYYWNSKNNTRIATEPLEEEAAAIVEKIIRNSKELQKAIKRRGTQKGRALSELQVQIKAVQTVAAQ